MAKASVYVQFVPTGPLFLDVNMISSSMWQGSLFLAVPQFRMSVTHPTQFRNPILDVVAST